MKRISALLLVSVLIIGLVACTGQPEADVSSPVAAEQTGFDSPEDAVIAYLEGLRDSDFGRMLNTFAIGVYVEHFDLESFLERLRVYLAHQALFPNTNEFITAMNIEMRRGEVAGAIRMQYFALTTQGERVGNLSDLAEEIADQFDLFRPWLIEAGEAGNFVQAFSELLNAPELHTLEILGFIPPETVELHTHEQNQEIIVRMAEFMGADQLVSRIAVFELDGIKYMLFVDIASYGGRWFLTHFGGNVSNLIGIPPLLHGLVSESSWYADAFFDELLRSMITEW